MSDKISAGQFPDPTTSFESVTSSEYISIPAELRALRHWVVFRVEEGKGGKPTKVPYKPVSGGKASSTNPAHWTSSYGEAVAAAPRFSGIGFMFQGSGFAGIDLDHCAADGVIGEWAQTVVDSFASYSEMSWSGTGVHILVRGQVKKGRKHGDFECYSSGRYFTMSGRPVPGTPAAIADRQQELDAFVARVFPADKPVASAAHGLLPFPRLCRTPICWRKQWPAKNGAEFSPALERRHREPPGATNSRADLALCNHLAWWFWERPGRDRPDCFAKAPCAARSGKSGPTTESVPFARAIACTGQCYEPHPASLAVRASHRNGSQKNGHLKNGSLASSPEDPAPEVEAPETVAGETEEWSGDGAGDGGRFALYRDQRTAAPRTNRRMHWRRCVLANDPPVVYVRGGQLARVQVDENNRGTIALLTPPMLRGRLARCANFVSTSEKARLHSRGAADGRRGRTCWRCPNGPLSRR